MSNKAFGYARRTWHPRFTSAFRQRRQIISWANRQTLHPNLQLEGVYCDDELTWDVPWMDRPNAKYLLSEMKSGDLFCCPRVEIMVCKASELGSIIPIFNNTGIRFRIGSINDANLPNYRSLVTRIGKFVYRCAAFHRVEKDNYLYWQKGLSRKVSKFGWKRRNGKLVPDYKARYAACLFRDMLDLGLRASAILALNRKYLIGRNRHGKPWNYSTLRLAVISAGMNFPLDENNIVPASDQDWHSEDWVTSHEKDMEEAARDGNQMAIDLLGALMGQWVGGDPGEDLGTDPPPPPGRYAPLGRLLGF